MPATPPTVVPVAISLPEPLASDVASFVESELGWQVVAADGPVPPVVRLVASDAAVPGAVVVSPGAPEPHAAAAALAAGAVAVLSWPEDHHRLAGLAQTSGSPARSEGPPVVRIGGVGGGVGTSTVALATAGLLAWADKRVVVVGGDDLCRLCGLAPWVGPGAPEIAALEPAGAAVEVDVLARPVSGVVGLRALGGGPVLDAAGWATDVVVADVGSITARGTPGGDGPDSTDLLVGAPDGRLAGATGLLAPVVICGDGPLDDRGAALRLGRAPIGRLPHSARVARAGLEGRVPASLPGSWLRSLAEVLVALDGGGR